MMQTTSDASEIHPRHPWAAALLSLGLPGLGQLYAGDINKALWLFLAFVLADAPGIALAALYVPSALMLPLLVISVLLTLAVWIGAIIDAWRTAARRQIYTRRDWQVSGLYALLLIAGNLFLFMLFGTMRAHLVQTFVIPTAAMQPGILPGDYVFADKRYNCPGCKSQVAIGDIGIFVYPNDRSLYYIKRVIGLPGDRVTVTGHHVAVNGKDLTHTETTSDNAVITTEESGTRSWRVRWNKTAASPDVDVTVPAGQIFLLGDNRDLSTDSRQFGTVPLSDLVGKARQIWFSRGARGIRWNRLGKALE